MALLLLFAASGADVTVPTVSSATLAADGLTLTLAMSEASVIGSGGSGGLTFASNLGPSGTFTYASGSGTSSLVFTASRVIGSTETITRSYTQPGDGIEDTVGNDLASFSAQAVTNSSTRKTWSVGTGSFSGSHCSRTHGTVTAASMGGAVVGYNIIIPTTYTGSLPIIFFQHGKSGSESLLITGADSPAAWFNTYLAAGGTPALLVCVNAGDNSFGYNASSDATEYGTNWETFFIGSLIPHIASTYGGDTSRMIGMGFSMGGTMMLRITAKYPGTRFLGCAMLDSPCPSNWSGTGGFDTTDNNTTLAYLGSSGGQALWEADNPRVNINSAFYAAVSSRNFKYYMRNGSSTVAEQGSTYPGTLSTHNVKLLAESLGFTVDYATMAASHSVTAIMAEDAGAVFTWAETLIQAVVSTAPPGMGRIRSSRHYPMRY